VLKFVTSPKHIDRLFKCGMRYANPYLIILVVPDKMYGSRVLIVAGKRLGGAVLRNRLKRVMRESVRRAGGPWPGHQVAIIARQPLIEAGTPRATEELKDLLCRTRLSE